MKIFKSTLFTLHGGGKQIKSVDKVSCPGSDCPLQLICQGK